MSLIIELKVIPSSGRQEWVFDQKSKLLKCFIKSIPEKGKANKEVINMIAKACRIPQQDIFLLSGDKNRTKRFKINTNLNYEEFLKILNIPIQNIMF